MKPKVPKTVSAHKKNRLMTTTITITTAGSTITTITIISPASMDPATACIN